MDGNKKTSIFFIVAALYDGILGISFLVAPRPLYDWLEMPEPEHLGYMQFGAALLVVFAIMFMNIARSPINNRNLIPYGILLKVSYCAVVFYHWFAGVISTPWKVFAVCDVLFGVLFLVVYHALKDKVRSPGQSSSP